MSLRICYTRYCDTDAVKHVLKPLTHNQLISDQLTCLSDASGVSELETWMSSSEDAVLILWPTFSRVLQYASEQGDDFDTIAQSWLLLTRNLDALAKRYRGRLYLCDGLAALGLPSSLFEYLGSVFSISDLPPVTDLPHSLNDGAFTWLASQFLKSNPVYLQAEQRLAALSIDLGESNRSPLDVSIKDLLSFHYDQQQQINDKTQKLYDLRLESENALQNLQKLSDQKEADLQKSNQEAKALEARLSQKMADLEEENTLLLEQLHLVQEALEKAFIAKSSQENAIHQIKDELFHTQKAKLYAERRLSLLLKYSEIKTPLERFSQLRFVSKLAKDLQTKGFFDAAWYLEAYPDVAADAQFSKRSAIHYLLIGGFEGRNPNQEFDSDGYLAENPDVEQQVMNPLLHYMLHGQKEGRRWAPADA